MLNKLGLWVGITAASALASTAAFATTLTYNAGTSMFSCGAAVDCTAAGSSVLFVNGGDTETITFTPGSGLINDTPTSNISYGTLSLTSTGSPSFSLAGVSLALNMTSTNPSGANGLLSTFTFSTPFGAGNPVATFSPSDTQIGNDVFHVSGGFGANTYVFSSAGPAQIVGTITAAPVPEPATVAMMLLGLAGVAMLRGRPSAARSLR